jgi:exodeoxyribonuclease VII small subunit
MSERDESAPPGFGEAMAELEEILHRIEEEEVDIDLLAAELRRATELLELCRTKIRRAEVEVTQIVQSLEGEEPAAGEAAEAADEAPPGTDEDDVPF